MDYPTPGVPRTPDGKPNLSAPASRAADGKPDLSGMWGWQNLGPPCGARCTETQISREFINLASSLNIHCMPRGAVGIFTDDYYKRIFQVPGRVPVPTERNMQYRQIFTDGRPLPVDPNPTWNGYSTAKWDGDTLVVQTIGFREDLWLDSDGNPLTNAGKVTEKFRRPNYGTLEIELTIDDPKAYTAPWTVKFAEPLVLDSELLDYYCLENEKDSPHMVGK